MVCCRPPLKEWLVGWLVLYTQPSKSNKYISQSTNFDLFYRVSIRNKLSYLYKRIVQNINIYIDKFMDPIETRPIHLSCPFIF